MWFYTREDLFQWVHTCIEMNSTSFHSFLKLPVVLSLSYQSVLSFSGRPTRLQVRSGQPDRERRKVRRTQSWSGASKNTQPSELLSSVHPSSSHSLLSLPPSLLPLCPLPSCRTGFYMSHVDLPNDMWTCVCGCVEGADMRMYVCAYLKC